MLLDQLQTFTQQLFLLAIERFKLALVRMHSNQTGRTSALLVVASTQWQNLLVGTGLCPAVNVVDADPGVEPAVLAAGNAAQLAQLIPQPTICL